jgi:hypothetical protein
MLSAATFPAKVLSHRSAQQQMEKQKKSKCFAWPTWPILQSGILEILKSALQAVRNNALFAA